MIIAVDFDGTIVKAKFPEIGEQMPNAFYTLLKLKEQKNYLILWTNRTNTDERKYLDEAVEYCKEYGVTFDAVNDNVSVVKNPPYPKIYADVFIDDKNFGYKVDWNEIEKKLVKNGD